MRMAGQTSTFSFSAEAAVMFRRHYRLHHINRVEMEQLTTAGEAI